MRAAIQGIGALVLVGALAACETIPPATYDVHSTAEIARPKAEVWADLIEWFTASQIPVRTIEADSGVVYAEKLSADLTDIADCGRPFPDNDTQPSITLNVFVRSLGENASRVTVNADFTVQRNTYSYSELDYVRRPFRCASTGALERQILSRLGG